MKYTDTKCETALSSSMTLVQGEAGTRIGGISVREAILIAVLSRMCELARILLRFSTSCATRTSSSIGWSARARSRSSRSDGSSEEVIELNKVSKASARRAKSSKRRFRCRRPSSDSLNAHGTFLALQYVQGCSPVH